MRDPACVGALIRNHEGRVFAHRGTNSRRIAPGIWDIVGGYVQPGETAEEALAREIREETGWELRRILAQIADWEWEHEGVVHRELDFVVEVDGDLAAPRLEHGKHDAYAWVGSDNLELMMEGRIDGDHTLRDIVARAMRFDSPGPSESKGRLLAMNKRDNSAQEPDGRSRTCARRSAPDRYAGGDPSARTTVSEP